MESTVIAVGVILSLARAFPIGIVALSYFFLRDSLDSF